MSLISPLTQIIPFEIYSTLVCRRKQKWTVDPRNTAWSNDDSKFGQRMLEKMGWSKGKGLGAQEQGATEHIKVKVKNNNLGLGATNNTEDGCSTSTADEVDTSMTTTTTSAFTIQEYFAKRMAQLKSKPQASAPEPDISETSVEWKKEKKKTKEAAVTDVENSLQHKAKRHKKKKCAEAEMGPVAKKRDQPELLPGGPSGDECSEVSAEAEEDCVQSPDSQVDVPKSKKRKAKKKLQRPGQVEIDTTLEKAPMKKKKKKASR
ncbi:Pinx1 [Phodopus roborovskii]|uniref:Pinx1 protein n=1 Tax=Phodopus roborovskii TaxID=109678 RepID=A0AAU9ZSA5_PHORO|nr:Pinx1 [Phodopus roborovskii]